MPDRTWSDGNVPTATDVNTLFRDQVITTCTSGTRPSSPVDGRVIFETDTRKFLQYSTTFTAWRDMLPMGAWTAYTPPWTAVTTNPTLVDGLLYGRYTVWAQSLHIRVSLQIGPGTSGGTGAWVFGLPATYTASSLGGSQGLTGEIVKVSTGFSYPVVWEIGAGSGTGQVRSGAGYVTGTAPIAFASGDVILFNGIIEL